VGELEGHGRPDQAGLVRVAGVAGDQGQGRAQPLAAGGDQVAGRLLDERVGGGHRLGQRLLDPAQPGLDVRLDPGEVGGLGLGRAHAYPRILSADLAAAISASGARPMATVSTPASPRAIPRAGARPGAGSASAPSTGSWR
jgi:hypothetical protein